MKIYHIFLLLLIFISGMGFNNLINAIEISTAQIETKNQAEDKKIEDIVKEELSSIIGIESYFSNGKINASGIIFREDGYIIANYHSIDGAEKIYIYFQNGEKKEAVLVGKDSQKDLAVLKVDKSNLPIVTFGNSDEVQIGQMAIAIGNPLGEQLSGTVTVGVISALNRRLKIDGYFMDLIQTDAAINKGNSGGALLDKEGKVIGINTFHIPSDKAVGIGFAIPSNIILETIDKIMKIK